MDWKSTGRRDCSLSVGLALASAPELSRRTRSDACTEEAISSCTRRARSSQDPMMKFRADVEGPLCHKRTSLRVRQFGQWVQTVALLQRSSSKHRCPRAFGHQVREVASTGAVFPPLDIIARFWASVVWSTCLLACSSEKLLQSSILSLVGRTRHIGGSTVRIIPESDMIERRI